MVTMTIKLMTLKELVLLDEQTMYLAIFFCCSLFMRLPLAYSVYFCTRMQVRLLATGSSLVLQNPLGKYVYALLLHSPQLATIRAFLSS